MQKVKQNRSIVLYFLLSIVTLSVYHFYFLHKWAQDVNTMCGGDGRKTAGLAKLLILDILTLGIYKYLWFAGVADRLCNNAPRYGVETTWDGESAFLWIILGLPLFGIGPIVAIAMTIYSTNRMAKAYNLYMQGIPNEKAANERAPAQAEASRPERGAAPAAAERRACLVGLAGVYAGRSLSLQSGEVVVIGRSPAKASVVINEPNISRCHCTVQYDAAAGCYYVKNCSRNGVSINGRPLANDTRYRVRAGVELSLADGANRFRLV